MEAIWKVERNTGSRAFLTCLDLRKEVRRPRYMTRYGFFSLLAPRAFVSDEALRNLVKLWP